MRCMLAFSKRAEIKNPIREVEDIARRLEERGKELIFLNIGDPLRYDFSPPAELAKALVSAVKNGKNYYADSRGIKELREVIAEREKAKADDVIITHGVSEAILFVMGAIISRGSEILVPGPTYSPYISYIRYFGGIPVEYKCDESNEWQPDLEDIEKKITKRTRALVLINPNNPTGAVYTKNVLKEIAEMGKERKLLIITDEIYDKLVFDEHSEHVPFRSVAGDLPFISLNGFSKSYMITGWRIGYICFHNCDKSLEKIKSLVLNQAKFRLSACTPVQWAIAKFMKENENEFKKFNEEIRRKLKRRARLVRSAMDKIGGLSLVPPKAAFYVFPKIEKRAWKNDKEFVLQLMEETGVVVVHGSGFGKFGEWHFRLVFLAEEEKLQRAMELIREFVEKA